MRKILVKELSGGRLPSKGAHNHFFHSSPFRVKTHLPPDGCAWFSSRCCQWAPPLLPSSSPPPLATPQGCNHLPHRLLIAQACVDRRQVATGWTWSYTTQVVLQLSKPVPRFPRTAQCHHTVQHLLGNRGRKLSHCAVWLQHKERQLWFPKQLS